MVELDTGVAYEVSVASLPEDLPPSGGTLNPQQHRTLALAADRKRAARRLFAMLGRRMLPVAKLRQRLLDAGHHTEAVEAVLVAMHEQGVHSDRQYADAWCRDCLSGKSVGKRYLESKLRHAGIGPEVARQAADAALDSHDEDALARRAAAACWRKSRSREPRDVARVVRYLIGRGFKPAVAGRVARQTTPVPGAPDDPAVDAGDDFG